MGGPGNIARTFAQNLLQHAPAESTRSRSLIHRITGVASSSSLTTAQKFVADNVKPYQDGSVSCTAYSSYAALADSEEVDVVYIATPHSGHFSTAMLCLQHNQPVLVEKPITVNAAQVEILIQIAKEKNLFLMEAMWTRFFPITLYVQNAIRKGQIGEVVRVSADFSLGLSDMAGVAGMFGDDGGRMLDSKRAGGVLLDLGIYALTWIFLSVYNLHPSSHYDSLPTLIGATMTPHTPPTSPTSSWVDATTTLLLTLPSAPAGTTTCHAIASTSLYTTTDPGYGGDDHSHTHAHRYSVPSVRIQGTHGEIQVFGPLPRPQRVRIFSKLQYKYPAISGSESGDTEIVKPGNVVETPDAAGYSVQEKVFESRGDGYGMFWEADEVARCLRDGVVQSVSGMSWRETLAVMRVMDEARGRCGLRYGEEVEGVGL